MFHWSPPPVCFALGETDVCPADVTVSLFPPYASIIHLFTVIYSFIHKYSQVFCSGLNVHKGHSCCFFCVLDVDRCIFYFRQRAHSAGKAMCERLRDSIPRQMFEIAVQAAIGSKIIARETWVQVWEYWKLNKLK